MKVKRCIEIEVKNLGEKIKKARKASDRSLESLASEAGISRVYWYDIENEKVRDSLPEETLRKIESALNIDLGIDFEQKT